MQQIYTPEINITFAQGRENRLEEEREKKKPVVKCKGFKSAIAGYEKKRGSAEKEEREERIKRLRRNSLYER